MSVQVVTSSAPITPYITSIEGKLVPGEVKQIIINGGGFLPDTEVKIEHAIGEITEMNHNRLIVNATCDEEGTHEVEIDNSGSSSKDWINHYVDCVSLPAGEEQRFTTGFSAKSQYNNSFRINNAFNDKYGDNHYCASGQVQGHWIEIDHGQTTLLTKIALYHNSTYSSSPFTLMISDNGVDWETAMTLTLQSNGQEIDIEATGIVCRYSRLVWSNPTNSFANAKEYILKGRQ